MANAPFERLKSAPVDMVAIVFFDHSQASLAAFKSVCVSKQKYRGQAFSCVCEDWLLPHLSSHPVERNRSLFLSHETVQQIRYTLSASFSYLKVFLLRYVLNSSEGLSIPSESWGTLRKALAAKRASNLYRRSNILLFTSHTPPLAPLIFLLHFSLPPTWMFGQSARLDSFSPYFTVIWVVIKVRVGEMDSAWGDFFGRNHSHWSW